MAVNEQPDPGTWSRVSTKKASSTEVKFVDPSCAVAVDRELRRNGGQVIGAYYRVNLYIAGFASVSVATPEASPLAGTKCSCKWISPGGPLVMNAACLVHSSSATLAW